MATMIKDIAPGEIEKESFRIIAEELGPTSLDPATFTVVQRVIHATGDFSFTDSLRFHPAALTAGIAALRAGRNILTDVTMVAAGVNRKALGRWGGRVICRVGEAEVADRAGERGTTRAAMAMEMGLDDNIGIVAVGNAPTALVTIMAMMDQMPEAARPALVVGVPVGFVNAAESKELLLKKDYPFITSIGRKGGSPVAAAIVNALLRLAGEN